MKNLNWNTIMNDTILAVELDDGYGRHWVTGTRKEVQWALDSGDVSDIDRACTHHQPAHLRPFYEAYDAYCKAQRNYGIDPKEYFEKVWKEAI